MRVDICASAPFGHEERSVRVCSCLECVTERDGLREVELLRLGESGHAHEGWAERSWNGPLAHFPGHASDDAGRPRIITR